MQIGSRFLKNIYNIILVAICVAGAGRGRVFQLIDERVRAFPGIIGRRECIKLPQMVIQI